MTESTSIKIILNDSIEHPVRFSYLYCFEPYIGKPDPQTGKVSKSYCSHFLMAPNHPDVKKVNDAIIAVAKAQWPKDYVDQIKSFRAKDKICLRKGEDHKPGEEAYKGVLSLSGNNKNRFTVVETRGEKNIPLSAADGKPYSGSYGNAIIEIWAMQNDWGRRINCGIQGIQFTRHGAAFGGGKIASVDEFGLVTTDMDGETPATTDENMEDLLGVGA